MPVKKVKSSKKELEKTVKQPQHEKYILRLYISGMTPRSSKAIANIKKILAENLDDGYRLNVIDIYQQPELARRAQIVAAPTLIKKLPLPIRRLIGDMTNKEKVLVGMDLKREKT